MAVYRWVDASGEHYKEVPAGEDRAEHGVPDDATRVGRMPGEFERWEGGWHKDEEAEADHLENARIRLLSPSQRHQEAIERAAARLTERKP